MYYSKFTDRNPLFIAGCDHNARGQRSGFIKCLKGFGPIIDLNSVQNVDDDYINITKSVCRIVNEKHCFGLLACGTGQGVSMIANKHRGIVAARCLTVEDAIDSRKINNANILCLSAKVDESLNQKIISAFFSTTFSLTDKRKHRLDQLIALEGVNFS